MVESVNCEICGRNIQKANKVKIEGTVMEVCNNCSSLGQVLNPPKEWKPKQYNTKLTQETVVDNYASLVKQAREKRGWTMEEFALRCQEKENFVHRVEQGHLKPDLTLARKLERVLGITLVVIPGNEEQEEAQEKEEEETGEKASGLTLGDFIKIKKKK